MKKEMKREKTLELIRKNLFTGLTYAVLFAFMVGFTACGDDDHADDEPQPEASPEAAFLGSWSVASQAGSLAVGPSAGSAEWWSLPEADVAARACLLDDTFTFGEDGLFTIDLGSETWLETWQGVETDGCGAPVAPHVSGDYGFSVNEDGSTLTITGAGAFIGLSKVTNDGEDGQATSITFNVSSISETAMTLQIEAGTGVFWQFQLTKN